MDRPENFCRKSTGTRVAISGWTRSNAFAGGKRIIDVDQAAPLETRKHEFKGEI